MCVLGAGSARGQLAWICQYFAALKCPQLAYGWDHNYLVCSSQTARAKKLEAQTKLEGLHRDIEQLGKLSGEQARAEEAQVEELQQVRPPPPKHTLPLGIITGARGFH